MIGDRPIDKDAPMLVSTAGSRLVYTALSDDDEAAGYSISSISMPFAGLRTIGAYNIYHGITLVLVVTEDGKYNIHRTINRQTFTLVHSHDYRICDFCPIDLGRAIFSATDGLFETSNSGLTWTEVQIPSIDLAGTVPEYTDWDDVPSIFLPAVDDIDIDAIVPEYDTWNEVCSYITMLKLSVIQAAGRKTLVAYGSDHKIWQCACDEDGVWEVVYDATTTTGGKWYPALAGSLVGMLAGAGPNLVCREGSGDWEIKQVMDGTIKSIIVSDQGSTPIFLITLEKEGEKNQLWWTNDLADTIQADANRIDSVALVESVYKTNTNIRETKFVISGRRASGSGIQHRIISNPGA